MLQMLAQRFAVKVGTARASILSAIRTPRMPSERPGPLTRQIEALLDHPWMPLELFTVSKRSRLVCTVACPIQKVV
jgi:hypothetical protein